VAPRAAKNPSLMALAAEMSKNGRLEEEVLMAGG
jgi:hypothetical protein